MVIRYTGLPKYSPVFTYEIRSGSSTPPRSEDGQLTPSPSSAVSDVGDGWGDAGDERLDNNTPTNDVDDDEQLLRRGPERAPGEGLERGAAQVHVGLRLDQPDPGRADEP